jgi:hypothetical protein
VAISPNLGFTDDELRSLGRKLRALRATLSPGERRALAAIVRRAVCPGDVEGFVQPDDPSSIFPVLTGDPEWDAVIERANEVEL